MQKFQCGKCHRICGNEGALKTHMKSCQRAVESPSLLKFLTKRAVKKPPIQLPVSRPKAKQSKLVAKPRPVPRVAVRKPFEPARKKSKPKPPRPPRLPRSKPVRDISQFIAPSKLTDPKLDRRSPEFRLAHVRYYGKLKAQFPFLDKIMYHEANKAALGVEVRRFRQFLNKPKQIKSKSRSQLRQSPSECKIKLSRKRNSNAGNQRISCLFSKNLTKQNENRA